MIKNDVLVNKILECDPAKFQKICDSYFRENGYPNIISYGLTIRGLKTKKGTPDSYSIDNNGKYTFFEYTTEQGNIGNKLNSDVKKCIDLICKSRVTLNEQGVNCKKIVFVAASNNLDPLDENKAQMQCKANNIQLEIVSLNQLCSLLIKSGKKIIEEELNLVVNVSPVCTLEEFIERNSRIFGNDFSKKMYGRENDIKILTEKIITNEAIVVYGDSGVGKTKLVIEYLKNQTTNKVIIVQNHSGDISHDLLFEIGDNKDVIVFFDDANGITQLKQVIEDILNLKLRIKMVFSVRNYARDTVIGIVSQFKIKFDEYVVKKLEERFIINIIENNYGIKNPKYKKRISSISNGNSRLAVFACEKVLMNEDSLDIWKDSASLLNEYYSTIIKNQKFDYDKYKIILCIVAIIGKIDLNNKKMMNQICSFIGVTYDEFVNKVWELYRIEIVDIYLNRLIQISDQCLKDYFIYDGLIKSRFLSLVDLVELFFDNYRKKIIESINMLINVYTSEIGNDYLKNELIHLWNKLEEENRISTDFIASFSLLDPNRAIKWVENRMFINQPKIDWKNRSENQDLYFGDDYLGILEHVFCYNLDYNSLALILEALNYKNLVKKAMDTIMRISSIQVDDFDKQFARQYKLIEILLMVKDEDYYYDVVRLVAKELLKYNYSTSRIVNGRTVEFNSFSINDEMDYCFNLRNEVWSLLFHLDEKQSFNVIYQCIGDFSKNTKKLVINDLDNIEKIVKKNHYNSYEEILIYNKLCRILYENRIEWNYFKEKYNDELDNINLLFDPKDSELELMDRKSRWENKIQVVAEEDSFELGIKRLTDANLMYLISKDYKLSTFVNYYLRFCMDKTIDWVFNNLKEYADSFGSSIIYSIVKRIQNVDELNEKLKLVKSDFLRDEINVCFVNHSSIKNETIKKICYECINKDFERKNCAPLVTLNLDRIFELCDTNDEFCTILGLINKNWENNKVLCEHYYSELFNPYIFSIEKLIFIFEKDIRILEQAFLYYLPSKTFDYKVSVYFFKICEFDNKFFDSSIEYVTSTQANVRAINNLWMQKNRQEYATKLFNYLWNKKESDYQISFFFADYFGLGFHSEHNNDDAVLDWAKDMIKGDKDFYKCKYLMKIIVETNSNIVLDFLGHLINIGISSELFDSLPLEPRMTSYSGSQVPQIEQKIKFYETLLGLIDNKIKHRKIVTIISERISCLKEYMKETKIQENLIEEIYPKNN